MNTIPPYLQQGDTIGIVCPSGYLPYNNAETCIATLKQWGFKVKVGKTLGNQFNYFSGTDEERLADLQSMLDDKTLKAILCGRGGYGLSRIIDSMNFESFIQYPKWIIGFSDITILHAHINKHFGIATMHAPMAAAFNDRGFENEYVQSLKQVLVGEEISYSCAAHPLNKTGNAQGELIGGNLTIIAHLIGSNSGYDTTRKILFMEDIGEYLYNIDRLFIQLKRSGLLHNLAALVIGGFTDMKDTIIPYGSDVYSIIHEHLSSYDYPVCFGFPVGHQTNNYALKVGGVYQLSVTDNEVVLKER